MLLLIDRYLLVRYWHAYFITFAALLGLYVIIDVFANVDEFMKQGDGALALIREIGVYYSYRACAFMNSIGGSISVVAAMLVLAVVQRHGELNPVLSAGIPTYRLARPLVLGTVLVNLALLANQELLIPRIAVELQMKPGGEAAASDKIKPVQDFSTRILILSGILHRREGTLTQAEFVLPVPEISNEPVTLLAKEAIYGTGPDERPGWRLSGVSQGFVELSLTALGRETVFEGKEPDELFIATDIGFEQLLGRNKMYQYLSTRELLERARNPSYSLISMRTQSLHLHQRFTRPLMSVILVLLVVPLMVRRESRGLVVNIGLSVGVVIGALIAEQLCQFLAGANLIPLDVAAWAPVILAGTSAAWFSGMIRT